MKIVNVTSDDINSLKVLPLNFFNTRGNLLLYEYNKVLRLLKSIDDENEKKFNEHLDVVKLLNESSESMPYGFVLPEFLVSVDDRLKYFGINYVCGNNLSVILKDESISNYDKVGYLKKIGIILKQMEEIRKKTNLKDFFLGDLHEDNFMVDENGILRTIDLDGAKFNKDSNPVAKYLSDFSLINESDNFKYHYIANPYITSYEIDRNTDIYCYVIVILNYLYNGKINNVGTYEFYRFMSYLNDIGVDKELINCFERILTNSDNINPCDYLDTLTPKQIGKARTLYKK